MIQERLYKQIRAHAAQHGLDTAIEIVGNGVILERCGDLRIEQVFHGSASDATAYLARLDSEASSNA